MCFNANGQFAVACLINAITLPIRVVLACLPTSLSKALGDVMRHESQSLLLLPNARGHHKNSNE